MDLAKFSPDWGLVVFELQDEGGGLNSLFIQAVRI